MRAAFCPSPDCWSRLRAAASRRNGSPCAIRGILPAAATGWWATARGPLRRQGRRQAEPRQYPLAQRTSPTSTLDDQQAIRIVLEPHARQSVRADGAYEVQQLERGIRIADPLGTD